MAENLNNKKHSDKSKNKDPLFFSLIKSEVTYTVKDNGETLTVVKGKNRWRNAKSETVNQKNNTTEMKKRLRQNMANNKTVNCNKCQFDVVKNIF